MGRGNFPVKPRLRDRLKKRLRRPWSRSHESSAPKDPVAQPPPDTGAGSSDSPETVVPGPAPQVFIPPPLKSTSPTQCDSVDPAPAQPAGPDEANALVPDSVTTRSTAEESVELWKSAYDLLSVENIDLVGHAEAVLKDQTNVPQQADMREKLADVAAAQIRKVENKQWKLQWSRHPIREQAERIVNLTSQWSALISLGMNSAPPYVSMPWAAVAALLPMMMNEFKEHQGAIDGLESTTKLALSYQLAEAVFLGRIATRDKYKQAVMKLYKKILEYQALAIQYFGKSTLRRLGKNLVGSTEWADMPTVIAKLDDDARRTLDFVAMDDRTAGFVSLAELLKSQDQKIDSLIQNAISQADNVAEIVSWVSGIPVEVDHADVRLKLGEGHYTSGRWFLAENQTRDWVGWKPGCRCLWLKGGMGTGKSSLTSILIEELVRLPDGIIGIFYCSKKVDQDSHSSMKRNNVTNILRSLLAQGAASTDGGSVHEGIKKRYERDKRRVLSGFAMTAQECLATLGEMISTRSDTHFTLVIDALDECEDYDLLLELIHSVSKADNVRFFFSSRLEVRVQSVFADAREIVITSQNSGDIERFLNVEIPRRRDGCGMTDVQVTRFRDVIMGRANGMFMWVKIQVNRFLHENKRRRIRLEADIEQRLEALEGFKASGEELLFAAYDDEYNRAIGDNKEPTRRDAVISALRWVLTAFRPLTLRELAYATSVDHWDGYPSRGVQEGDLLEFCGNLLVVDTSGIMQLAHLSVRQYLEGRCPPDFTPEASHLEVALTSLYFIQSPGYREMEYTSDEVIQKGKVALTKGFCSYVAAHWSSHCQQAPQDEKMKELIEKRTMPGHSSSGAKDSALPSSDPMPDLTSTSASAARPVESDRGADPDISSSSGLDMLQVLEGISGLRGLTADEADEVVARVVARNSDLSTIDQLGETILHYVVRFRRRRGTDVLLRAGAPVNLRNSAGNTPLHIAAMYRYDYGVQQLLLAGADRNSRNNRGETALHLSLVYGSHATFETLLSATIDVLARDHQGSTIFHYAALWEDTEAVKTLLCDGYSPDHVNNSGDTALSLAIKGGNKDMIDELLRHHARVRPEDVDAANAEGLGHLLTAGASVEREYRLPAGIPAVGFTARVAESPQTCEYCNVGRWLSSRRGRPHPHWTSFADLHLSAARGCAICGLFARDFLTFHPEAAKNSKGRVLVTVHLAFDQPWEKSGKDMLSVSLDRAVTREYEICLDGDKVTAEADIAEVPWLVGRLVEARPEMKGTFALLREWYGDCSSAHNACRDTASLPFPSRLVDIGKEDGDDMRLVETQGRDIGAYTYLSHAWGLGPELTTKKDTLQMRLFNIPAETVSAKVADSIAITRAFGIRYIWTDTLCIIQDDEEDWMAESAMVPMYCQGAAFVVVTASNKDDYQGVLRDRPVPLLDLGTCVFNSPPLATAARRRLYLRKPLQTALEASNTMAMEDHWLVQELLLPRRLLVWGDDQVYWACRTCLRSEGNILLENPIWAKLAPPPSDAHTSPNGLARGFLAWYSLIEVHSRAKVRRLTDCLPSMAEMARHFNDRSIRSTYVAGLWTDDLPNGLLWYVTNVTNSPGDSYIVPSWSWASTPSPVTFGLLPGIRPDIASSSHRPSVMEASTELKNPAEPYRTVSGGCIAVEATVRALDIADAGRFGCHYFFDFVSSEHEWRGGHRHMLMFVSPWSPGRLTAKNASPPLSIGLILRDTGPSDAQIPTFRRVGLFLGLRYDASFDGWRRETLRIV